MQQRQRTSASPSCGSPNWPAPAPTDPLARLLASPVAPRRVGVRPALQLLHVDDAVAAVETHHQPRPRRCLQRRGRRARALATTGPARPYPTHRVPRHPVDRPHHAVALVVPAQRGPRHPRRVALRPACRNRRLCSLGLPAEQHLRTVRSSLTRPWFAPDQASSRSRRPSRDTRRR